MVLIECKNYATALTLEKVRNFFAVLHDIGNCVGLMVTRTGYQSGVEQFARYYEIGLKLLRSPEPVDWKGMIKDIQININFRAAVSREDRPIRVFAKLETQDAEHKAQLDRLQAKGRLAMPSPPDMVFWSRDRKQATEELRWWLSKRLDVLKHPDGGPYKQTIPLDDLYFLFNAGESDEVFVKVRQLDVEYFVETIDNRTILFQGEKIVEAILKDFTSGEVEYVKTKK